MIVCSCNVLSDNDVRNAVSAGVTRHPKQVYGCLGCSAECGRCARTIKTIVGGALLSWATCREGKAVSWIRQDLEAVLAPWLESGRSRSRRNGPKEGRVRTR